MAQVEVVAKSNGGIPPPTEKQFAGIYAKLHAVMSDCGYIQRDKRNSFHNYTYASEAAIKDKVHAALVGHGVIFFPLSATIVSRETGLGKDGKDALTTVRLVYKFCDIETGEEVSGEFDGIGQDPLDKGCYKAITGAIKYILTSTFLIPTGDDPEEDEPIKPKPAAKPLAQPQPRPTPASTELSPPNTEKKQLPSPKVLELWRKMKQNRESFVEVFRDARSALEDLFGKETGTLKFLDIIHKHGIQSAEGYKGKMQPAHDAVLDLYNVIKANEPPPLSEVPVVEEVTA